MVVDFPEPFGPRKPVTVPGRTSKDRSSTAVTSPNRLESPRASITLSLSHAGPVSKMRDVPVAVGDLPDVRGRPGATRHASGESRSVQHRNPRRIHALAVLGGL